MQESPSDRVNKAAPAQPAAALNGGSGTNADAVIPPLAAAARSGNTLVYP